MLGLSLFLAIRAGATENEPNLNLDPAVTRGKLESGETYYLQRLNNASGRIYLSVVVNGGALEETENSYGFSHVIEHLQVNRIGAETPIGREMSRGGLLFGRDWGAAAGFYSTYWISIPVDRPDLLRVGIRALREQASFSPYEAGAVKTEVDVVAREGAVESFMTVAWNRKAFLANHPARIYQANQEERFANGLKAATPEALSAFAKNWYRPNCTAIVLVGAIDNAAVEAEIKEIFAGPIDKGDKCKIERLSGVRASPPTSDKLLVVPSLDDRFVGEIYYMAAGPGRRVADRHDLEQDVEIALANQLLLARFRSIEPRSNMPSVFASFSSEVVPASGLMGITAFVQAPSASSLRIGTETASKLLNQVRLFGFSKSEIDDAKSVVRQKLLEIGTEESVVGKRLGEHYIFDSLAPSIGDEKSLKLRFLERISKAEIDLFVSSVLESKSGVLTVLSKPEGSDARMPSEKEFVSKWRSSMKDKVALPHKVRSQAEILKILRREASGGRFQGAEAWSDGTSSSISLPETRIIAMDTSADISGQKAQITVSIPRGSDLFGDNGAVLSQAIANMGAKTVAQSERRALYEDQKINISVGVGPSQTVIRASSKPANFEALLGLLGLYLTQPEFGSLPTHRDSGSEARSSLAERDSWFDVGTPVGSRKHEVSSENDIMFQKIVSGLRGSDIVVSRPESASSTAYLVASWVQKNFKGHVSNLQTVATANGTRGQCEITRNWSETKSESSVNLELNIPLQNIKTDDFASLLLAEMISRLLHERIFERLRVKEGLVYDPTVSPVLRGNGGGCVDLIFRTSVSPGNATMAKALVDTEIKVLSQHGVSADELETGIRQAKASGELTFDTPTPHEYVVSQLRKGREFRGIPDRGETLDHITIAQMNQFISDSIRLPDEKSPSSIRNDK